MQKIDFFDTCCQYETTTNSIFGIHDELHNNTPAFLVFDTEKSYMLKILNPNIKSICFYPIDNCVIIYKENSKDKESTCDGMLVFDEHLVFVELAESHHKSVEDCIEQISSTIFLFKRLHSDLIFNKKLAVVSNLARPTSTISFERCLDFKEKTGFGLSVKTILNIK